MKIKPLQLALLIGCMAGAGASSAQTVAAADPGAALAQTPGRGAALKSPQEQISYATGVITVRNFAKNGVGFDSELLIQGLRDALAGKPLAMTDKEIRLAMSALQTDLRRGQVANQREWGEKNIKAGREFQAVYKARPGVNTLGNGVMFRELRAGTGRKPTEADAVLVKYRGTLLDGSEFDATEGDRTATLRLSQAIIGWREALKMMPVGAKWEIVIPHMLAYGERGVGQTIGPNETLLFEVDLVGIKE
jgi:FKBP-type peptidyl-prolyl cis-trans isomerase